MLLLSLRGGSRQVISAKASCDTARACRAVVLPPPGGAARHCSTHCASACGPTLRSNTRSESVFESGRAHWALPRLSPRLLGGCRRSKSALADITCRERYIALVF